MTSISPSRPVAAPSADFSPSSAPPITTSSHQLCPTPNSLPAPPISISQIKQAGPFTNWAGNITSTPAFYFVPQTEEELKSIVLFAQSKGLKIRPVGSGHSFSPLVSSRDIIVALNEIAGPAIKSMDRDKAQVTVKAGATLQELGPLLHSQGLALENQGDIDEQTIAGAISTGTHGTGVRFPSMSSSVVGLRLLLASGESVEASSHKNPELFRAAQVSLGSLGIITEVTLQLVPAFNLQLTRKNMPLNEALAQVFAPDCEHRNIEMWWHPCAPTQANVQTLNPTSEQPTTWGRFTTWLSDSLVEDRAFSVLVNLASTVPRLKKPLSNFVARNMSEIQSVDYSYKTFEHPRTTKFEEMEYSFPLHKGEMVLREIAQLCKAKGYTPMFPLECRTVKEDAIPLSPFNGQTSAVISVHRARSAKDDAYFTDIEAIFCKYAGKPHWGKVHSLTAQELATLYGQEWRQFQKVRTQVDPKGMFTTPEMEQLLGPA